MPNYIGLDVGGTKIEGVLVNEKLRVLKRAERTTDAHESRESVIANIVEVVHKLKTGLVKDIGIGVPGFLDEKGKIQLSPNIPQFENFNLKQALERKLNRIVHTENDANCFVLAEQKVGAARGMNIVLGITLGTGVGGGIVIDGKLYLGKDGGAAHFGQMIVEPHEVKGDLESWCGGKYLAKRYKAITGKNLDAKEIFLSKDRAAIQVVKDFYQKLGIGIANLINIFNPEGIVLGGGISNKVDLKKLRKEVERYGHAALVQDVKILRNKLGPSAGMIGAASLAIH